MNTQKIRITRGIRRKINETLDIREYIPGLKGRGATRYCDCPFCGDKGRTHSGGLRVTHTSTKNLAKCFSCGKSFSGPIAAAIHYSNLPEEDVIQSLAVDAGVDLNDKTQDARDDDNRLRVRIGSFCAHQLEASGLEPKDVIAKVIDKDGNISEEYSFVSGFIDTRTWELIPQGNEMVIRYFNLWGKPVMFNQKGKRKPVEYQRIRWSNPDAHLSKKGNKPKKYESPFDTEAVFYIPQAIRNKFQGKEQIETLIIQEGEKKAEKACKHGLMSIGIQGIYNIGNSQSGLIPDLQYIVQECNVKNIVLLLDADWQDLSKNLKEEDDIDARPRQFAKAVIKFRTYVETLHKAGLHVDVYFGHINHNEAGDKGVDDLLTNTLKGEETRLLEDFNETFGSINGEGEFINVHKVSTLSDYQIYDFWKLNNKDDFFNLHRDEIQGLSKFKFSKVKYSQEGTKIFQANSWGAEIDLWDITENEQTGKEKVSIKILETLDFLKNNGYYSLKINDIYKLVREEDHFIHEVIPADIRRFVYDYILDSCRKYSVRSYFANNLTSLLNADRLERLDLMKGNGKDPRLPGCQFFYFPNGRVKVTPTEVKLEPLDDPVWADYCRQRDFERIEIIKNITYSKENGWYLEATEAGKQCEILLFLVNASNLWWNTKNVTEKMEQEFQQHLVNKVSALGYLLTSYNNDSERKAIVAMDSKLSEVGQSRGRTGKSMLSLMLKEMKSVQTVQGRQLEDNPNFMFSEVTHKTQIVFFDDIKVNFNFPSLYNSISGDLAVNVKQGSIFTIDKSESPKICITTNHAINDEGDSSADRICHVVFSDFYNANHKPIDDFGHNFFSDWDDYQWTLFYNFMVECCMYYLRFVADPTIGRQGQGLIAPPLENVRLRTLRQQMSEVFLQWANTYFAFGGPGLGHRIDRKDMYNDLLVNYPEARSYVKSANFGKRLKYYCQYCGLHFNKHKPNEDGITFEEWCKTVSEESPEVFIGDRDCSNGIEYITISLKTSNDYRKATDD